MELTDGSSKFLQLNECLPLGFPVELLKFAAIGYDKEGNLTDTIDMVPGGTVLNIEAGQWHSLRCLESGTVLLEAKDGKYEPLLEEDILR